jgi:hypothetical protein
MTHPQKTDLYTAKSYHALVLLVVFSLFCVYVILYPRIVDVTKRNVSDTTHITEESVELPYKSHSAFSRKHASKDNAVNYEFNAHILSYSFQRMEWRISTNDCIKQITVNGSEVPLDTYTRRNLCGPRKGFYIDLGQYTRPGPNVISVIITDNNGGNYSFSMSPAFTLFGIDLYYAVKLSHIIYTWIAIWVFLQISIKLRDME